MERLSMMGGGSRAMVGEPAPRFTCKAIIDGRIKEISGRTLMQNNQWLILIFFPMAYSFICPGEIVAFNARRAEFLSKSTAVLFASTDSEHVLKAWNATPIEEGGLGGVSVPLLSDRQRTLAKEYGVLIEEEGIAQRGVFVIDPTGIIRWLSISDANVGRSVDEILRVLDALKFTDEYGQGCPIDWKAGQAGIALSHPDDPTGTDTSLNMSAGPIWMRNPSIGQRRPASTTASPPQTPPAIPEANASNFVANGYAANAYTNTAANRSTAGDTAGRPNSLIAGARPGIARGLSWTTAPWGKGHAVNGRPKSAFAGGSSPQLPSTPSGPPTPGLRQRPMSLFWGGAESVSEEAEGEESAGGRSVLGMMVGVGVAGGGSRNGGGGGSDSGRAK